MAPSVLSKCNPTVLAKVREEAESVAAYCSNANSASWHEGLMNMLVLSKEKKNNKRQNEGHKILVCKTGMSVQGCGRAKAKRI